MGLNDIQITIIRDALEYRRDVVIRRIDTYRKMKDALSDDLYRHLIDISHNELELILDAISKVSGADYEFVPPPGLRT